MTPYNLLKEVWKSGAVSVWVKDQQAKAKWKGRAPAHIRGSFIESKDLLGKWIVSEARAGRRYIWNDTISDLVCISRSDEATKNCPDGAVPYCHTELTCLDGVNDKDLRLIHSAKKAFGGRIEIPRAI